jgi:hypothetical protein
MQATINGVIVTGTPQEIADYQRILRQTFNIHRIGHCSMDRHAGLIRNKAKRRSYHRASF